MQIAFLGLGSMGAPMVTNLLAVGYRVCVWNRTRAATAPLIERGAVVTDTPASAASNADVVITMLADDDATRAVMLGAGALDAMQAGAIHVNMATISVSLAAELAGLHQARATGYLAAPVLGRLDVAQAGQLNILAAGAPATLNRVQPLLDVLGKKTWYLGALPEQANATKLAINFMIASAIGSMGEAVALVQGHGVDKVGFLELLTSTVFAAPVYQGYGKAIAEERFAPAGFKLALGLKDVRLALAAAEAVTVPMPLASTLRDAHIDSLAHGDGQLDWAALSRTAARRAGSR